MYRRYNLTYFLLVGVVALGLTLLMVVGEAQARIAFESDRDWDVLKFEIYVMDNDGGNQLCDQRVGKPNSYEESGVCVCALP